MKKYLLIITFFLGLSVNGQYAIMSAVDLNDGAENDYLKLEKFWSAVHKEAINQGLQTGWSVWKRTPQEGDEAQNNEYLIFDLFESILAQLVQILPKFPVFDPFEAILARFGPNLGKISNF